MDGNQHSNPQKRAWPFGNEPIEDDGTDAFSEELRSPWSNQEVWNSNTTTTFDIPTTAPLLAELAYLATEAPYGYNDHTMHAVHQSPLEQGPIIECQQICFGTVKSQRAHPAQERILIITSMVSCMT